MKKQLHHIIHGPVAVRVCQQVIVLICLCAPFLVFKATAQQQIYAHYTIKDGLPSNKIYHIRQAPDGYIWISTHKGVARFDGNHFRNFTVSDGLPTNDVFGTYTDPTGKTWLADFKNGIHYLENDVPHEVYNPEKTIQDRKLISSTYDNGTMCVYGGKGLKRGWYWYVDRDTLRRNTFYESMVRIYGVHNIAYCDLKMAAVLYPDHVLIVRGNRTWTVKIPEQTIHALRIYRVQAEYVQVFNNKLALQTTAKSLLTIDLQNFKAEESVINALNTSWILGFVTTNTVQQMSTNTGLIIFDASLRITDTVDLRAFTGKEDICSAYMDRSGNVWIATRNNGVYVLPFLFKKIRKLQLPVTTGTIIRSVHTGTHTYLLNTRNHLLIYDKGQYQRTVFLPDKLNPGRIPENCDLLPDRHNGLYISSIKGLWYLDAQGRLKDMASTLYGNSGGPWASGTKTAFYEASDDRYYLANSIEVFSFSPRYGTDTGLVDGRYRHIAITGNRVWLANDNGISQWEKTVIGGKVKLKAVGPVNELQVERMIPDREGNVITQIGGKGVMVFGVDRPSYLIPEPRVQLIKLIRDGLCVVSDNGIKILALDAGKYRVRNYYPNIKGLLYDEIYDLYDDDGAIMAMTQNGILKIPLGPVNYKDTLFTRKPKVSVHYAGNRLEPVKDHVGQSWQNSNTSFSIQSFSFSYLGDIRYEYFIEGLDYSRQFTLEPVITYPVLPPGTYRFHIRVKVIDLAITSEEVVLTLVIRPRWWQSLWFKAGIGVLILTTVALIFAWRIRRTRLRSQYQSSLEHKAAQMELMALQSQMNPHFIFNALGAVKSYFKFNRVEEAEKTLEEFAQLIRLFLEFSRNQLISLQQDILALQLYTAIEQRRFAYKFSVHFFNRMSAEQESNWQLPPMILQPFVENAINHGLFRKQEKGGRLRLFFLHREKRLTVVIDDNGVGRKRAAEIGSRFQKIYPSRGNNLIADRIQVLNGLGIAKIKYEIIDKYDRESEPAGTRVIIHFLKD